MRILAASNYVAEAGEESYIATPITRTMTAPPIEAAVRSVSVLLDSQSPNPKPDHLKLR